MPVAINFEEALNSVKSASGGAFSKTAYIPRGKTSVLIVQDERGFDPETDNPASTVGVETVSYYAPTDNVSRRYMTLVVVLDTDGDSLPPYKVDDPELPDAVRESMQSQNATHRVLPLSTQVTAFEGMLQQMTEGWELSRIDDDGNFVAGDVFVISKTGTGTDTDYSVSVANPKKSSFDKPERVLMPEKTLRELAEEDKEWQLSKRENNSAAMQDADESSFS